MGHAQKRAGRGEWIGAALGPRSPSKGDMEFHLGKSSDASSWKLDWARCTLDELYETAYLYTRERCSEQIAYFRQLRLEHVTPELFWREYVWGLYTSGFKASIVTKIYPRLIEAFGPLGELAAPEIIVQRVIGVFGNKRKAAAGSVVKCSLETFTWTKFRSMYCDSIEKLQSLPYVGKITKYHLARNLGYDVCKPDLHLCRLARYFSYEDPERMCAALSITNNERIGVVDYVLWNWCSATGTSELELSASAHVQA